MPAIPEGKHTFDFPNSDDWYAFKYDEIDPTKPGFYQARLEKIDGLKGVDIVAGIRPAFHTLTLIEVKDFRHHAHALKEEMRLGTLLLEIMQKAIHTCGGLYLGARSNDALLDAELLAAMLRPTQRITLVLFLAQDAVRPSLPVWEKAKQEQNRQVRRQDMLKKLREKLGPLGIVCALAESNNLPKHCGWTVKELP
ncbi:hypothetical protein A0257_02480 [Hymenobacter psoromatis]|nr:hypothetical protein A0257_02480 [Hymenobacter psoromatis]